MNIAQLSEQLKDVPQNRLIDYAKNPNSVVPQFLALAEIQRRQHLASQAQPAPATVAEDVLGQAAPQAPVQVAPQMAQQLPENQPGVAQLPSGMPQGMASGGIVAFADGGDIDEEDEDAVYDPEAERIRKDENMMMSLISRMKSRAGEIVGTIPRAVEGIKAALPQSYEAAKQAAASSAPVKEGDIEGFLSKIQHLESRGRHFDAQGNILTSPKGAEGIMQVMRKTQKDPGYGVTPAKDRSPEELERVGRDYGIAMLKEFGDPKLAAMAYNWGPGNVKKWLASGQKTSVPEETRKYASNFAKGGIASFAGPKGSVVSDDSDEEDYDTDYLQRSRNVYSGVRNLYDAFTTPKNYDLYDMYQNYIGKPFASGVDRFVNEPLEEQAAKFRRYSATPNAVPTVGYNTPAGTNVPVPASPLGNAANKAAQADVRAAEERIAAKAAAQAKPYEPSKEDYDIGFGPNKFQPDTVPEQAGPPRLSREDEALARNLEERQALKEQAQTDKYLAMLQASLGMMAGSSPYALQNIGAGGMQGVSAYAAAKKQRAAEAAALGKEEREILRMKDIKEYRNESLAQEEKLKKMGYSQKDAELMAKEKLAARDDLRMYEQMRIKQIESKYTKNPLWGVDPKLKQAYDNEVANIYNEPQYLGLYKLTGLPIVETGKSSTTSGSRPPLSSFKK